MKAIVFTKHGSPDVLELREVEKPTPSSGADVVAAIRVAERLGPGAKVVMLMADSGLKYLSTDVYRGDRRWQVSSRSRCKHR